MPVIALSFFARTEHTENTEFCYIRAPINAGHCEIQRDAACCVSTWTFEACLEPSFGRLPDVKFLLGTDFAADCDRCTNQHQVFDDVLPFEGQYHGEV